MADASTPLIDKLVASVKTRIMVEVVHNLRADSLRTACDYSVLGRPGASIIEIAEDASDRFGYITQELTEARRLMKEHQVACDIVRGLVIWRVMNDEDVTSLLRNRGLAFNHRGFIINTSLEPTEPRTAATQAANWTAANGTSMLHGPRYPK